MNSIKHRFTLDMHTVQSQISIPASIYDTARTLYINFTDGGTPYHISDGCTALLIISKPSGAKLYEWCAIKNNTNVIYPFSQNKNTASEEGICECEITLYSAPDEDGEIEQIASPRFSIVVSERAINRGDDEVLPEASIGFIDRAVKDELVRRQNEEGRVAAENARVSAETARVGAETARANAESARATAETERASAESARKTAENARASAETARATAEAKRITDEEERARNEAGREAAERIRQEGFSTWQDEWGKISSFDKRIENLEAAVSPGLVTPVVDDEVAYAKTVPNGVLPNAAVTEVGGMSYRCENLFQLTINTTTQGGVTLTPNGDGSFTVNGTATSDIYFNLGTANLETGTYTLCGGFKGGSWTKYALYAEGKAQWYSLGGASTYTVNSGKQLFQLAVYKGTTVSNLTVFPMVNKGSTALPYQPYFEGLRDSKVTAVESVGTNLWSGEISAQSAPTTYTFANGTMTLRRNGGAIQGFVWSKEKFKAGAYKLSFTLSGVANSANFRIIKNSTASATNIGTNITSVFSNTAHNISFTLSEDSYLGFGTDVENVTLTASNIMLNSGSTALPYQPYFRESLPIPADALEGFGQGVNAQCYNKIVLDPLEGVKKYVKNIGKFDMGALNWDYSSADKRFFIQTSLIAKVGNGTAMNALCTEYTPISFNDFYSDVTRDKTISRTGDYLFVRNLSYTSAAAFKTAMSGVMLLYELAAPTETDVSTLFADDNLLSVETGGTITAVNEYEQAAPFSIEYTVKGA